MVTREGFPEQVSTEETLTRGDALRAASEWASQLRMELASRAAWRHYDDGESRSFAAAQDAANTFTELPEDSTHPSEAEKRWRLRVQLYASAADISYVQANAKLRDDLRLYRKLLDDTLATWQQQELGTGICVPPFDEVMAELSYLWCNDCGMDPMELFELLSGLHAKQCIYKKE
jgi:hypothetical protein